VDQVQEHVCVLFKAARNMFYSDYPAFWGVHLYSS